MNRDDGVYTFTIAVAILCFIAIITLSKQSASSAHNGTICCDTATHRADTQPTRYYNMNKTKELR